MFRSRPTGTLFHAVFAVGFLPYTTYLDRRSGPARKKKKRGGAEKNVQMKHGVHLGVLHLLADVGANDLDLLLGVAQLPREERVCKAFETLRDLQVVPRAHFFLRGGG